MMKIMITGAHGQLGKELIKFYRLVPDVELLYTDIDELDITVRKDVQSYIKKNRPNMVINAAAYTAVDRCEDDKEKAFAINVEGTKYLAQATQEIGAVFVHISTDYVFDGLKQEPYVEEDMTNPKNFYGITKAESEQVVLQTVDRHYVIRTSWLFGEGHNFVNTMLNLSKTQKSIQVVNDQKGSPTSAAELVRAIDFIVKTNTYGIYHACCDEACTWAEFADYVFDYLGLNIKVEKVLSTEYKTKAERPLNTTMSTEKLKKMGFSMISWKQAVEKYLDKKREFDSNMDKKKVLVTGANGYLGRHVVKALLDKGHDVYASDLRFDDIDDRAKKCDVQLFSRNEHIYDELDRPDIVIHLAWRNGFIHNADTHIADLYDHYIFLKHLIDGGLPRLSVMGTMHEVGYFEGAIKEDTPTNPISLYGIAKNSLRQMLNVAKKDTVDVTWLRAYYILGDDLKNNSVFSKLTQKAMEGAKEFPFTSGKNKYDFISVTELANQIAEASLQNEVLGVINCCTGNPVSLADKVEEYIAENNLDIKLQYGAFPDREYDSSGVWGDPTKINRIMSKVKKV
ncbi:dTDP-4-dehydrorhamnose reductase [Granulicatella sp. zg-84]|nr:dTDP-4-dehydrorhamnose reductase [Granulicatella sp. zg-84]